jgi:hypothetical protein
MARRAPRATTKLRWWIAGALLVVLLCLPWLDEAERHAGVASPLGDWTLGAAWAIALGIFIAVAPWWRVDRSALLRLWCAKVAVVLGVILLYEAHYADLDAYAYFQGAKGAWPGGLSLAASTENVVRLAWLPVHALPSFRALEVSFAFIGFLAAYVLYDAACRCLGRRHPAILYAVGLFPAALLWSSIVGKDPLTFLGIALAAWAAVACRLGDVRRAVIGGALAACVFLFVRIWLLVLVGFPVLLVPIWMLWRFGSPARRGALAGVGLLLALGGIIGLSSVFGLGSSGAAVTYLDKLAHSWAVGGSGEAAPAFTTLGSVLLFLPWGAFTALFRPLPGELWSPFGLIASLESVILLVLFVGALTQARRVHWKEPLFVSALIFTLLWASSYAFVSYQNLGTGVRFRLQVVPAILALAGSVFLDPAPRPLRLADRRFGSEAS